MDKKKIHKSVIVEEKTELPLHNFNQEQNILIKKQYDEYAKEVQIIGQKTSHNSTNLSFKLWEDESETNDWF